ncbi:hypothetical protein F2Q70_00017521 [Brassica cretica]|uniref:Uncharacterized protein n=1 Tax=Brassica cretica TaxID=69181 RepID=A0A8S9HWV1_BRACR|nr:hypothetical protein F2Q70_00017521 [Brassica cretica]
MARLLSASPGPCGLTLSSSAPAFLVVMSSSEVYQGTWPGKAVVRWSEPWIRNQEAGIRNLEAGTRNPEAGIRNLEPGTWNLEPRGGRAAVFSALRQGFFAEQLQWNSTIKTRNQQEPKILEVGFEVGTRNRQGVAGTSSRVNHGSGEKKLFLAPRWLGLRDFAGIDVMSLPSITLSHRYMARKSGCKVVGTLDLEPGSWDPEPGSWNPEPRGGRAAVFLALGQGSFRGTTPMEFDEYSKAFYPPRYQAYLGFYYHLDSRT